MKICTIMHACIHFFCFCGYMYVITIIDAFSFQNNSTCYGLFRAVYDCIFFLIKETYTRGSYNVK